MVGASLCLFFLVYLLLAGVALDGFRATRLGPFELRNPRRVDAMVRHNDDARAAVRVWTVVALTALVAAIALLQARWMPLERQDPILPIWAAITAAVTLLTIALDRLVAAPVAALAGEAFLYWTWPVVELLRLMAWPVAVLELAARRIGRFLSGNDGEEFASPIQEEILSAVNEGEREGAIHEDAADMIEGLIELHEVAVSDVMTPRTNMVMLKRTATIDEARRAIIEHGHSRIPVHGESRDEIVGLLYAKDLLPFLESSREGPGDLRGLHLRDPLYVPETKPVNVLLREFQKGRVHIAIVLDEYGGVAGLVTIEDILEQIVGDITDEHDPTEPAWIARVSDHAIEVDARVRLNEVNESLPLGLPENAEYDTIGGFAFNHLGRIPRPGESFQHEQARFTVLEASERAIQRLRIDLAAAGDSVPSAPAPS